MCYFRQLEIYSPASASGVIITGTRMWEYKLCSTVHEMEIGNTKNCIASDINTNPHRTRHSAVLAID